MRLSIPGLLAGLLLYAAATQAQFPAALPENGQFWRAAAATDVDAAYRMLLADHPGAVAEAGDTDFLPRLDRAHQIALERAGAVMSFPGYAATLMGFANAMGDQHVRARPILEVSRPEWTGLLIGWSGTQWRVVDEQVATATSPLLGARLLGCDGRSADDWGREILGEFRIDWSVEAQRSQAAAWLLISEGNPFVGRPARCEFSIDGSPVSVQLQWRPIGRADLAVRMQKSAVVGAAGYGVRRLGTGYWIALQELTDRAPAVLAEVESKAASLRAAPFVVLDLRGNGGGSSFFGDRIAYAILGRSAVESVIGTGSTPCGGDVFRVSDNNLRALQRYVDELGPKRGPEFSAMFATLLEQSLTARAAGRNFAAPLTCAATPGARPLQSTYRGQLYLLTDARCFSSCLAVVDNWRRLGALQLGATTDANTRYQEVRDDLMPSGLATFSTMMAVDMSLPLRFGPFVPDVPYDGDVTNTRELQKWVLTVVNRKKKWSRP